jgi:hypothetical protein
MSEWFNTQALKIGVDLLTSNPGIVGLWATADATGLLVPVVWKYSAHLFTKATHAWVYKLIRCCATVQTPRGTAALPFSQAAGQRFSREICCANFGYITSFIKKHTSKHVPHWQSAQ